jgi:hypothetical protein
MLHFRRHVMPDAPSNRLTTPLTRLIAASIVAAGLAVPLPSSAQPSQTAASSGFQSQGIKATITSISLTDRTLILQFIIQNTRQTGVYIAIIGGYGGSAGTLMATNGAVYKMTAPGTTISGIDSCFNPGSMTTTDQNIDDCLKTSNENDMSMVDAGQTAILGIIYSRNSQNSAAQSDNINFALKFLVRSAPGPGGSLAAAAAGRPGPPSVVTITFPLIPLSE